MKKPQIHVSMEPAKLSRLEDQAEHLGVSAPTLAGVVLSSFADVQPAKVFQALGGIPESFRRPTKRPGATS
jgi:hypothetical protein